MHNDLGVMYYQQGKYDQSEEEYETALANQKTVLPEGLGRYCEYELMNQALFLLSRSTLIPKAVQLLKEALNIYQQPVNARADNHTGRRWS